MSRYYLKDLQGVLRGLSRVANAPANLQTAQSYPTGDFLRSVSSSAFRAASKASGPNLQEAPARIGVVLRGVNEYAKVCCGCTTTSGRNFNVDFTKRRSPDKTTSPVSPVIGEYAGEVPSANAGSEDEAMEAAKRAEKFMNQPVAPMDPADKNDLASAEDLGATPSKVSERLRGLEKALADDIAANRQNGDLMKDSAKIDNLSLGPSGSDINLGELNKKNTAGQKSRQPEPVVVKQTLGPKSKERKVPASRAARLATFGSLAAGLGVGAIAEVTRRTLGMGNSGSAALLDRTAFLTDANAERIVDTLCKVRGAALKLGQMLSIQDTSLLNPQIREIFDRVRQSADFMPKRQMESMMEKELGKNWRSLFLEFADRPFAAASIGQVHLARLHDGREVAVKIQYPGVGEGIDSDITNLMAIMKMWNVFPKGLYMEELMKVARVELGWECDYLREAEYANLFRDIWKNDSFFVVPEVMMELTTKRVLTMEYVYGETLDKGFQYDQDSRDSIAYNFLRLCFEELFIHRLMQTDPNWANFLYNPKLKKVYLLDFGASRRYDKKFIDSYIEIIHGAATNNAKKVLENSRKLGFLTGYESKALEKVHIDAVMILGEPFKTDLPFDFGNQDITKRIHNIIPIMAEQRLTAPPEQSYSLHRKIAGAFLLCANMRAKIRCKEVFDDIYRRHATL